MRPPGGGEPSLSGSARPVRRRATRCVDAGLTTLEWLLVVDLRVYAAHIDPAGAVIDVFEPTPVTLMLSTFDHTEIRTLPTQLPDGTPADHTVVSMILDGSDPDPLVWAGSAARTP